MGSILQPDRIDHTQLSQAEWQNVLQRAMGDLRKDRANRAALQAINDAVDALNRYEEPAIEAGERVGSTGFGHPGAAVAGLGQAALDVPKGIARFVQHPIESIKALPQVPGAIVGGLASGDPQQIARTVGNIGSLALPGAKVGKGTPSLGALTSKAVSAPLRAAAAVMERPRLLNQLTKEQITRAQRIDDSAERVARIRTESAERIAAADRAAANARAAEQTALRRELAEANKQALTARSETARQAAVLRAQLAREALEASIQNTELQAAVRISTSKTATSPKIVEEARVFARGILRRQRRQ